MKRIKTIIGARLLRKKSTRAEILLWKFLSDKGLCGFKFRRQHPTKGFVLDFYCSSHRLAIEIDGKIHDNQKEQDLQRQDILENAGIRFLRFNNTEVLNNTEMALKTIKRKLADLSNQSMSTKSPLHEVERGAPTKSGRGEDV